MKAHVSLSRIAGEEEHAEPGTFCDDAQVEAGAQRAQTPDAARRPCAGARGACDGAGLPDPPVRPCQQHGRQLGVDRIREDLPAARRQPELVLRLASVAARAAARSQRQSRRRRAPRPTTRASVVRGLRADGAESWCSWRLPLHRSARASTRGRARGVARRSATRPSLTRFVRPLRRARSRRQLPRLQPRSARSRRARAA